MKNSKIILFALVILITVVGLISGLFLVSQRTNIVNKAAGTVTYQLSGNNLVIEYNGFDDSVLDVNVHYVDGTSDNFHEQYSIPIGTTTKTLALQNKCVIWIQVHGTNDHYTSDCSQTATPSPTPNYIASCTNIKIYDTSWNQLTVSDLSHLAPGRVVNLTVMGSTTLGSFDKARFVINSITSPEVTNIKPESPGEFYYQYTIPSGVSSFTIVGQLHHLELNSWF